MTARQQAIFTLDELATYLKVGKRTLYRLAAHGEIPAFKVGGTWRFRQSEIDRWINDQIHWPGLLKPALDIQETDKQYKISLEVPGVEEKDIHITLDNDVLLVRGEKRQEQESKDGGFHRVERSYGSFQRALNLPTDANQDTIKAAFKNGVLTITMEKREASAPKQGRSIPING
ncbi:Hsp20 family protein [Escherichia coli]|nr:Hsp20 family protein [Escherichia coli]MCG3822563.1 Hsp20 family protein [Escherichia coli]